MNRSILLAGVLCIPVFYALMKGDFVVILMSVVAGFFQIQLLSVSEGSSVSATDFYPPVAYIWGWRIGGLQVVTHAVGTGI